MSARWLVTALIVLLGLSASLSAQSDPTTLPRVQASDVTYVGSFRVPNAGTANGAWAGDEMALNYGGNALGLGPDGQSLYIGCHDWFKKLARVSIPAIGGTATVITPCAGVPGSVGSGTTNLGGSLVWNGRLIVTKYLFYDASGSASASHASGATSISGFGGFQRVGTPGHTAGYMAVIPPEWRTLLGGPALTGQGALSIISRSSSGPAAFVFDPDNLAAQPIALADYPLSNPLANPDTQNALYTRADVYGGIAFPAGTRSVLFIGRHGKGRPCYGEASDCGDQANNSKGEHAYPYAYYVWAYDANDLLAVKRGQVQPWQVKPYATWELPGLTSTSATMPRSGGAVYDPATRRIYLTQEYGESPRVHVFEVAAGSSEPPPPPPDPVDCVGSWSQAVSVPGACVDGSRAVTHTRTFSITTPASNGGAACEASHGAPAVTTTTEPCDPEPDPSGVVNVSTEPQLRAAVAALRSGQTIRLAAGTYQLADALFLPQQLSDIAIIGATGNRDDVVVRGAGMTGAVRFGFWLDNVQGVTFANLTIRDLREHGVIANGGADRVTYRNLHLFDIGDQFLKHNPIESGGVDDGVLEDSLLEYSTVAPDTYTNGLDVHRGERWIVRRTTFRNFRTPNGIAGPAILVWNGSRDTVVEDNTFADNARDISLGLDASAALGGGPDHVNGIIRGNTITRQPGLSGVDVPILVASPDAAVTGNSVTVNGTYPNAIEIRWPTTTAVVQSGNAVDGGIVARDGATFASQPVEPVDCAVSAWSSWQPVTEWSACVDGSQSRQERRTRAIVTQPSNGGAACPAMVDTRTATQACELQPAPIDCVGSWSQAVSVPGACVDGVLATTHTRTFLIMVPAANGGAACEASDGATAVTTTTETCALPDPEPEPTPADLAAVLAKLDALLARVECVVTGAGSYANGDQRLTVRCPSDSGYAPNRPVKLSKPE